MPTVSGSGTKIQKERKSLHKKLIHICENSLFTAQVLYRTPKIQFGVQTYAMVLQQHMSKEKFSVGIDRLKRQAELCCYVCIVSFLKDFLFPYYKIRVKQKHESHKKITRTLKKEKRNFAHKFWG